MQERRRHLRPHPRHVTGWTLDPLRHQVREPDPRGTIDRRQRGGTDAGQVLIPRRLRVLRAHLLLPRQALSSCLEGSSPPPEGVEFTARADRERTAVGGGLFLLGRDK